VLSWWIRALQSRADVPGHMPIWRTGAAPPSPPRTAAGNAQPRCVQSRKAARFKLLFLRRTGFLRGRGRGRLRRTGSRRRGLLWCIGSWRRGLERWRRPSGGPALVGEPIAFPSPAGRRTRLWAPTRRRGCRNFVRSFVSCFLIGHGLLLWNFLWYQKSVGKSALSRITSKKGRKAYCCVCRNGH
jgi:hypothetical protein